VRTLSHGLDRLVESPRKKAGTLPGNPAPAPLVAWGLASSPSARGSLVAGAEWMLERAGFVSACARRTW